MIKIVIVISLAWILNASEICEEEVSGTFGSITSPGYLVEPYPKNLDCYYRIKTSPGTAVTLNIVDMNLDSADFIEIYDGYTNTSDIIGRYTGIQSTYIYASTNEVMIYFHTDNSIQTKGFYIYFVERGSEIYCPAINHIENDGFIASPNFPDPYPNNADCYYSIGLTDQNTQVTLHVLFLDVETTTDCSKDFVEIHDGPTTKSPVLAKLCGTRPLSYDIISSTNEVFIHFHSDSNNEGSGFNISFNTDVCSGPNEYNGDFGTIYSPGYPLYNYSSTIDCKYAVVTPVGSQVHLTVNYMNMTYQSYYCPMYDYVIIYDGPDNNAPILATLCGVVTFAQFQASTNEVLLVLRSRGSIGFNGFSITYTANYIEGLS